MSTMRTMLVVDDDITICESLRLIGESSGYVVTTVQTPQAFLTQYATLKPNVITLDLNLGENDGIELLRALAAQTCDSRIILISGFDPKVIESALLLGKSKNLDIMGAMHKPIDNDQLRTYLNQAAEKVVVITNETIGEAADKKEFLLYYQPKIDIKTGAFLGVEALIRWHMPESGLISPESFITIAEESNIIVGLSSWVNNEAIKHAKILKDKGHDCCMSINVSAKLLNNLMLPDEIYKVTKNYNLGPRNVCVEITETTAMGNPALTMDVLTRFRIKGFSVSVDDFGTGYSSLVELQRMPFSELKIDKSFVMHLTRDSSNYIIVRSIINLGRDFGLKVVAEGVETREALDILKELGCDVAQGYYIARPMSFEQLLAWLATHLDTNKKFKFLNEAEKK